MAQKLDERRGSEYDDSWKPPIDDADDLEDTYNSPTATDADLPEGHPSRTKTPEQLATAEAEPPAGSSTTAADQTEADQLGKGYTSEAKQKVRRKFWTRKKAIGGGIVGLLIGGSFGVFSILQGPFQIIQFAQWLSGPHMSANNEFSNSRATKLWRIIKYPHNPEMRRLGTHLNKYASRVEARWKDAGFEPKYDGPSNRLDRFILSPDVDTSAFRTAGVDVVDIGDGFHEIKFDEALYSKKGRLVFNEISKAAGYNKAVSALNTRVLRKRAGVTFKLFDGLERRDGESLLQYYKRLRDRWNTYYGSGELPTTRSTGADGPDEDTAPDPDTQGEADAGNHSADDITDSVDGGGIEAGRTTTLDKLNKGDGVLGVLCIAKAAGENYPKIQYAKIILPLIRQGTGIMSMGTQVMAGKKLNISELGAISSKFFSDAEISKGVKEGSWVTAKSIQAEMGRPQTGPDILPNAKPSRIGSNPIANAINGISKSIPGFGTACKVQSSAIGGFAVSLITGGVGGVIGDFALDQLFKSLNIDVVGFLTRLIAGKGVDTDAAGSTLGNFANYGARLAANDQALATGGTELTNDQEGQLDDDVRLAQAEHFESLPLSDRLFAMSEPNSLVSRFAVSQSPLANPDTLLSNTATLVSRIIPNLVSAFSSFGTSRASGEAVNNGYDYGFPMYGFTQAERDDPKNDPDRVATELDGIIKARTAAEEACNSKPHGPHPPDHDCNYIPSNVAEFNALYEKCFGTRIIPASGPEGVETFESLSTVNYFTNDGPEARPAYCQTGQPDDFPHLTISPAEAANDLRLWRFYIADTVIGHSMLCYEGEEASCKLFGYGGSTPSQTQTSPGSTKGQDTSAQTCQVGTDAGIGSTPDPNIKIRLCTVGGITVNVAIEGNVKAVLDGGGAAGLTYAGAGYRSYDSQVQLRKQHCGTSYYDIYEKPSGQCSPPTATPGNSMHEWGLAVDFTCNGSLIRDKNSRCFGWLEENQGLHKLLNLPSESWHWSPTGN